jgi:hypothetical protein
MSTIQPPSRFFSSISFFFRKTFLYLLSIPLLIATTELTTLQSKRISLNHAREIKKKLREIREFYTI